MKFLVKSIIRIGRTCFFNTPVRSWKFTARLHTRLGKYLIGSNPFPEVEYMGIRFTTNGADASVTTALINGHYERFTLHILDKLIQDLTGKSSSVIFTDVGANIGIFTSFAATRSSSVIVYSFEPNPVSFRLLKENLNRSSLINVTALNCAVGSASGMASLDITSDSAGTHSIFGSGSQRIEVPVVSIQEFFETKNLMPDIIKIDVEGYEPQVMNGIKSLLETKPLKIIMEFNPDCLRRGKQIPETFLADLLSKFDAVYCLDEVMEVARRLEAGNSSLEQKILSTGFNLLLIKGPIPAFLGDSS